MLNFCIYIFIIYAVSNSAAIILFGSKRRKLRQKRKHNVYTAAYRHTNHGIKAARQVNSTRFRASVSQPKNSKRKTQVTPAFCFCVQKRRRLCCAA